MPISMNVMPAVVPRHVAELLVEELGVVFAVLGHQFLVGLRHARLMLDRILVVLGQPFAALDPAAGLEIDARMLLEVVEIPLLAAEEQRNAIVGAGNDQRDVPGRSPSRPLLHRP